MSHEELDRFGVISRVRERRLTQVEAARILNLGVRQVQRLLRTAEKLATSRCGLSSGSNSWHPVSMHSLKLQERRWQLRCASILIKRRVHRPTESKIIADLGAFRSSLAARMRKLLPLTQQTAASRSRKTTRPPSPTRHFHSHAE
jgi:hypothetical protein